MGTTPKVDNKPKYNKNKPYEWVDSQWEKFMTEQKELKSTIQKLQNHLNIIFKHIKDTPNDMELGDKIRKYSWSVTQDNISEFEQKQKYIYESPDNGRTIYRREFGKDERVLMEGFISGHDKWEEVPKNPNQLDLFND